MEITKSHLYSLLLVALIICVCQGKTATTAATTAKTAAANTTATAATSTRATTAKTTIATTNATTAPTTTATTAPTTTATTARTTTATTAPITTATTAPTTTATTAPITTATTAPTTTATTAPITTATTAITTAPTTIGTTAVTTAPTTIGTTAVTTEPITTATTEVFTVTELTDVTTMTELGTTMMTTFTTEATTPATKSPTPKPPVPVHPPVGVWNVTDDKRQVCMKMHFGARFVIKYTTNDNKVATATIDVPTNATAVAKCKKGDKHRKFKLHLFDHGTPDLFHLELTFNNTGSGYKLTQVGSNYTLNPLWFKPYPKDAFKSSYQSVSADNFLNNTIPLHNSFTCTHTLNFSMVHFTLYDVKLMPYADEAKGDFGEVVECKNSSGGSSTNVGLVVGIVIAVVFVLIIIAVVCAMKKSRLPNYEDTEPILKS